MQNPLSPRRAAGWNVAVGSPVSNIKQSIVSDLSVQSLGSFPWTKSSSEGSATTFAQEPKQALYGGDLFIQSVAKARKHVAIGLLVQLLLSSCAWCTLFAMDNEYSLGEQRYPRIATDSITYVIFIVGYSVPWLRQRGNKIGVLKLVLFGCYAIILRPLLLFKWTATRPFSITVWYCDHLSYSVLFSLVMLLCCFTAQAKTDFALSNSFSIMFPIVTFFTCETYTAVVVSEVLTYSSVYHFLIAISLSSICSLHLDICGNLLCNSPGVSLDYTGPLTVLSAPLDFIYVLVVSLLPIPYMLLFVAVKVVVGTLCLQVSQRLWFDQRTEKHEKFHYSYIVDYGLFVGLSQIVNVVVAINSYYLVQGRVLGDWRVWTGFVLLLAEKLVCYLIYSRILYKKAITRHYAFDILSRSSSKRVPYAGMFLAPTIYWFIVGDVLQSFERSPTCIWC